MKTFNLPDLGEGLPDAEIVEWHVKEGDLIKLDAPLVSMETAKAVVEVPSPYTGTVVKLFGGPGDVIATGSPLAGFELAEGAVQRAEAEDTGHHHGAAAPKGAGKPVPGTKPSDDGKVVASDDGGEIADDDTPAKGARADGDAGTVVGAMESSDRVHSERVSSVGGVKAMPAVRALAKKLKVDLSRVRGSGAEGVITMADVKNAAANPPKQPASQSGSAGSERAAVAGGTAPTTSSAGADPARERTTVSATGRPVRTSPPGDSPRMGQPEPLRGVRRNMARIMAQAHAQVVPTTLCDDADLHAWPAKTDVTARLVRAIVAASREVPALNAWFDGEAGTRTLHPQVDLGIAVDTPEGLFVPALRNADLLDPGQIREAVNRLRVQVEERSIPPEELKGYTISLSNFGVFAGRYATPVVVPPCVAIVAAGKARHEMRPVVGGFEAHRIMPISLTFDHRAATGGEAARFLKTLLDDLQEPA